LRIALALAAATLLAACGAAPTPVIEAAQRAGFTIVAVSDRDDKPIEVAIWYPTNAAPASMDLGLYRQSVARDAPVAGRDLPLVVMSHGTGGGWVSHADTAVALASAGFVVAAPTHTGDNYRDESYVGTGRWLPERVRQMRRVVDYMQKEWKERDRLDGRVGVFGFSAGAFTALVMVGGVPDMGLVDRHCRQSPELACTLWKEPAQSSTSATWIHDSRISAAVVAAPGFGFTFEPAGLAHVTAAVQLWGGGDDRVVRYATNTALVRRQLPAADYHDVARAGHLSFIVPCAGGPPPLCQDAEGFDRAAFHAEFNRAVIAFYRARLEKR